jgi:hypothetical protein
MLDTYIQDYEKVTFEFQTTSKIEFFLFENYLLGLSRMQSR